jgi:hypothetical protein
MYNALVDLIRSILAARKCNVPINQQVYAALAPYSEADLQAANLEVSRLSELQRDQLRDGEAYELSLSPITQALVNFAYAEA